MPKHGGAYDRFITECKKGCERLGIEYKPVRMVP